MSALGTPLLLGDEATGYQISRSVRLRSSASGYFNNASTRTITTGAFTFSMWFKRGTLGTIQVPYNVADGSGNSSKFMALTFLADDSLRWYHWSGSDTDAAKSNGVLRDPAAWYHVVLSKPAGGVGTMYLNGVAQTKQTSYANDTDIFATTKFLGRQYDGVRYFDGYIAEVHAIDGQALTPSSFGETDAITGVWKPKRYAGTYGTNGFYLNFSDNSAATAAAIGKDWSGNGNNWTPNNISVTAGVTYDSMLDVPTPYADGGNGRGNYAVMNPLKRYSSNFAISNGNLTLSDATASNVAGACSMSTGTSGQYYFECTMTAVASSSAGGGSNLVGVATQSQFDGSIISTVGSYRSGNPIYNLAGTAQTAGATYTTGDVIGVAVDVTNGTVQFYKNGAAQGATPSFTFTAGTELFPFVASDNVAGTKTYNLNFGQRPFAYTPPTGFKALNTHNLPDATIKKGKDYFNAVPYAGTAGVAGAVTGVGFQPDLVWVKSRNAATGHVLVDAVRGVQKGLFSAATTAEVTSNEYLLSFDSDGFSYGVANAYSQTSMVAWNWKESASAGFDIVTYTGNGSNRTIAHNLGVAPKLIIVKDRNRTTDWSCLAMAANGGSGHLGWIRLNTTDAWSTTSILWNNTAPTSSVFSVGTYDYVNYSGSNYVAYLFAEVAGFSKFGSYTGNASADGPFVFTGHTPRFVMIKRTDTTGEWMMFDTARKTYNVNDTWLRANDSASEIVDTVAPTDVIDHLSNGFKVRGADTRVNASGGTYIYAAFAENPFKNSLAR